MSCCWTPCKAQVSPPTQYRWTGKLQFLPSYSVVSFIDSFIERSCFISEFCNSVSLVLGIHLWTSTPWNTVECGGTVGYTMRGHYYHLITRGWVTAVPRTMPPKCCNTERPRAANGELPFVWDMDKCCVNGGRGREGISGNGKRSVENRFG